MASTKINKNLPRASFAHRGTTKMKWAAAHANLAPLENIWPQISPYIVWIAIQEHMKTVLVQQVVKLATKDNTNAWLATKPVSIAK